MKSKLLLLLVCILPLMGAAQSQPEMNEKARKSYEKADIEMTRMYKKVMASLATQEQKNLLLEAQRAWIKYKEAHCKAIAYEYDGGSMAPLIYYSCLAGLTNFRKKDLKEYVERY